MAQVVVVLGESGSGKSTSLRNLTSKDVNVISVLGKNLPFKTDIKPYHPKSYAHVVQAIEKASKPIVVLDDANYLMSLHEFATIDEQGYGKFARNAQGMVQVFNAMISKETDQVFYVFAHTAVDETGKLRFKTTGKMVDEKFNINGITNTVLEAMYDDQADEFVFKTKADGSGVKSPLGMFDTPTVPNDLKAIHKIVTEFYKEQ